MEVETWLTSIGFRDGETIRQEEPAVGWGKGVLGEIPLDAHIRVSSDEGRPVALESDDSPVARAFHELAGRLAERISIANAAAGAQRKAPVVVMR